MGLLLQTGEKERHQRCPRLAITVLSLDDAYAAKYNISFTIEMAAKTGSKSCDWSLQILSIEIVIQDGSSPFFDSAISFSHMPRSWPFLMKSAEKQHPGNADGRSRLWKWGARFTHQTWMVGTWQFTGNHFILRQNHGFLYYFSINGSVDCKMSMALKYSKIFNVRITPTWGLSWARFIGFSSGFA